MDILDDMGVSKLSAKVFSRVNYYFKGSISSRKTDLEHLNGSVCGLILCHLIYQM